MIITTGILTIYVGSCWISYYGYKELINDLPYHNNLIALLIVFLPIFNTIAALAYIKDKISSRISVFIIKWKLRQVFKKVKNKEAREELMNILKDK